MQLPIYPFGMHTYTVFPLHPSGIWVFGIWSSLSIDGYLFGLSPCAEGSKLNPRWWPPERKGQDAFSGHFLTPDVFRIRFLLFKQVALFFYGVRHRCWLACNNSWIKEKVSNLGARELMGTGSAQKEWVLLNITNKVCNRISKINRKLNGRREWNRILQTKGAVMIIVINIALLSKQIM